MRNICSYVVFLFFFFFSKNTFSDVFLLEGRSALLDAQYYMIHSIPIEGFLETVQVKIYLYESFNNGVNQQVISNYIPKITPKPSQIERKQDSLGNRLLEITFSNVSTEIRIESKFFFDHSIQLIPFKKKDAYFYPFDELITQHVQQFLKESKLTKSNEAIQKLVQQLTRDQSTDIGATLSILQWIRSFIQWDPNAHYEDSERCFVFKKGNRNAILNLSLAMLRTAGIPARVAHGISASSSLNIATTPVQKLQSEFDQFLGSSFIQSPQVKPNQNFEILFPKSFSTWLEIYFPKRDWVLFDPFVAYFFLPYNFLRRNVGIDSQDKRTVASSSSKNLNLKKQFFVEFHKSFQQMTLKKQIPHPRLHLFSSTLDPSLEKKLFPAPQSARKAENTKNKSTLSLKLKPSKLEDLETVGSIDVKESFPNYFAQKVLLSEPLLLRKIRLPLLRFSPFSKGNLWLELYSSKKDLLKGQKQIKSSILSLESISELGSYTWVEFDFTGHNSKIKQSKDESAKLELLIQNPEMWIVLKHNSAEPLFWKAVFGNPIQDNEDTLSIQNDSSLKKIQAVSLYMDLCFEILGKNLETPSQENTKTTQESM